MSRIKSKGMKPELVVRELVYGLGYRYRLHASDLPGRPDLVFRGRHKVIFVHGCFWHLHNSKRCNIRRFPKSNVSYWTSKLLRNQKRDAKHIRVLRKMGWACLVIWECELRNIDKVSFRIGQFLGGQKLGAIPKPARLPFGS